MASGERHPVAEPISVRVPEAARLIGPSRSRLYALMKSGEIEYVRVGGTTLIPYDDLRTFIGRQRRRQTAAALKIPRHEAICMS